MCVLLITEAMHCPVLHLWQALVDNIHSSHKNGFWAGLARAGYASCTGIAGSGCLSTPSGPGLDTRETCAFTCIEAPVLLKAYPQSKLFYLSNSAVFIRMLLRALYQGGYVRETTTAAKTAYGAGKTAAVDGCIVAVHLPAFLVAALSW